jgi:glycosyltransferase involved in cell wall biosynthesis
VCWEETAGGIVREYRRRVRIVSRSWRAIFQVPQVLNPFRVGIFALSVVSHKILRWFAGSIAVVAMASLAGLTARLSPAGQLDVLMLVPVALVIALIISPTRRLLALGGYFAVINAASAVGLFRGTFGLVSGTWAPPRAADVPRRAWGPAAHAWGRAAALGLAALLVGGGGWLLFASRPRTVTVAAFWISVGTLVYIYLGYPLVMFVWRTLGRRPTRDGTVTPSVCLFIAAHNEEAVIRQKLWNSLALDYPPDLLQIVVASDGSDDETAAITRSVADERVRLLEFAERRGKISAINRGMACVASEVVVFSDANTFLEPDALRRLVGRFADPEVGGVSGDVILVGERAALAAPEDLYYWYERWLQAAESDAGTMVGADGALYAVRRALFVAPPDDTILDDMAIPIAVVRAGRRVVFEPGARAFEQGSRSAREEFSRKSRVVAGAVQLVERSRATFPWRDVQFMFALVSHKALRWLSPWFAVVAFMSSAGLAQTAWGYVEITIAQGLFLGAGLAGCVPALRRLTPVAVAHYFLLVQAAALIGLARGILHRQPTAWRRFERAPVDGAPATPDRTATERISG